MLVASRGCSHSVLMQVIQFKYVTLLCRWIMAYAVSWLISSVIVTTCGYALSEETPGCSQFKVK